MSYQAPFADAATAIDPNNRGNTFISYYTYGQVIGLALDLSLRNLNATSSLDDFMKVMWNKHGKTESGYNVRDIQAALAEYTSPAFANDFFDKYIFKSELPDYAKLLEGMGISLTKSNAGKAYLGTQFRKTDAGLTIASYTRIGTPAYKAGLESGDVIVSINGTAVTDTESVNTLIAGLAPGKEATIVYKRLNAERTTKVILEENPALQTKLFEDAGLKADDTKLKRRAAWLNPK